MKKLILSPYFGVFIFILQILIWLIFMPEVGESIDIVNLPYKYITLRAVTLYLIFIIILIFGIAFGKKIRIKTNRINYKLLYKYNTILFIIWFIAEINSCNIFLRNPLEVIKLLLNGEMWIYSQRVRDNINILETFVNLFPLIMINNFLLIKNNIKIKQNKRQLIIILIGVIVNGIFVFKRIHFIYFFIIAGIFYLRRLKRIKLKFYIFLFVIVGMIILGEWLRYGALYSKMKNLSLFSLEVFFQIVKYLLTAYLANDYNNTMILLDSPSSYQFISTGSPIFREMVLFFNGELQNYKGLEKWSSGYGTVNSLGLWWFDCGIFTPILCFGIGSLIGCVYRNFKGIERRNDSIQMIAPVIIMANILLFRFNIFLFTIVLIPVFFYMIFIIFINNKYK